MTELPPPTPPSDDHGFHSEQLRYEPVGARLPDKVAPGVFCTGAIVIEGPGEFVLDFIQGMARPPRVGARVILHHHVMGQFVAALRDNLSKYEAAFGPPKAMPRPNVENRPNIKDLYDQLKMADDQLSGVYATTVMIGHSPAEFAIDFITRFFPKAAVAARIFIAASNVPRTLETLNNSFQQHVRRVQAMQGQQPRPPEPMTDLPGEIPPEKPSEPENRPPDDYPPPGPEQGF